MKTAKYTPTELAATDDIDFSKVLAYVGTKITAGRKDKGHGKFIGVQFGINRANPATALQANRSPSNGIMIVGDGPTTRQATFDELIKNGGVSLPVSLLFASVHARQTRGIRFGRQA